MDELLAHGGSGVGVPALGARRGQRASAGESPWARRRRTVRELRAAGRYGPRLREVLPGMAGLAVTVCGATAALAVAGRALGWWVPAMVVAVSAGVAVLARRRARRPSRRRHGYYTAGELTELDLPELVVAVARMLRRDGWRVLPPSAHDTPHLVARDRRGRLLDVAFRPVAEPLPGEDTACCCRARRRPSPGSWLVVHRGAFTHRDEVWAARRGDTHLVDGARLRLWAAGTPLGELAPLGAAAPRRT